MNPWRQAILHTAALRQLIRTFVAGALAIILQFYLTELKVLDPLQGYWLFLTALLLVQVRVGYLWWHIIFFQLLFVCLLVLVVAKIAFLPHQLFLMSLILAVITFLCVTYGLMWPAFFLALFYFNFYIILWSSQLISVASWSFVLPNLGDSQVNLPLFLISLLLGLGISLLVTTLIWPSTVYQQRKQQKQLALFYCCQLLECLCAIGIKRDYLEKHLLYEKKIYSYFRQYFICVHLLRQLRSTYLPKIESLFRTCNACCNLRFRIKDHATFEIIEPEFKDLKLVLPRLFSLNSNCNSNSHKNAELDSTIDILDSIIDRFENTYKTALQVASSDPQIFLFFIQDLRVLAHELGVD